MNTQSQIIIGILFGLFFVTAWNLAMIERDRNMFEYYCTEHNMYCQRP